MVPVSNNLIINESWLKRIREDFAKYRDIEVEFRLGYFREGGVFRSGIERRVYDRFIKELMGKPHQEENSEDFIRGPVRKRVILAKPGAEEPKTTWLRKETIYREDSKDYPFRLAISREEKIPEVKGFTHQLLRRKHRYSFYLANQTFRLDITRVEEITERIRTTYEVELEILSSFSDMNLNKVLIYVVQILQDTSFTYTERQRREILTLVNKVLGGRGEGRVDPKTLVQSRNIKLDDLVWGGLVGNPQTTYQVTHKADGLRKLLVFHTSGTWLIMPPYEVTLVTPQTDKNIVGTILDGEYIPPENRTGPLPRTKYWYLAFDCLSSYTLGASASPFDPSIQLRTHNERMAVCGVVASRNQSELLHVNSKTFLDFHTPETFFRRMREMFAEQPSLGYKQDGFIFTPLNVPYNTDSEKFTLRERALPRIPDNCKWKPPEQLTIDLALRWVALPDGVSGLEAMTTEGGKYVPFMGSQRSPLEDIVRNDVIDGVPTGTVVEFLVSGNRLVPVRVREKPRPNRREVALDVWADAHSPLTEDTLKGDSFVLVRRYHNRIKRDILSSLPRGSTLLDLGSGRGADIGKWKHLKTVVAVEPSDDRLREFHRRATGMGYHEVSPGVYSLKGRTIYTLKARAEDTERITTFLEETTGKVDAVSTFLSMTFFWESPEVLHAVVRTIRESLKDEGMLLFLTINGVAVEQVFSPRGGMALSRLDLGNNSLAYEEDKRLTLHFPGTIIEDQNEPLVFLEDLMLDFDLTVERADKEKLLTPEEAIFTNLYVYGKGRVRASPVVLPPPDNPLKALPVVYDPQSDRGIGDDDGETLPLPWFNSVLRIASIDDGSSFFHSLLKGFYAPYRETESYVGRTEAVTFLRRDLALSLARDYVSLMKGAWLDLGLVDDTFSLPGLQKLFNSRRDIGEAFYEYVAHSLGVDVYLLEADEVVRPRLYTGQVFPAVVLLRVQGKVELIGLQRDGDVFTLFPQDDPFIDAIRRRI